MRRRTSQHTEWLSLVESSGPFLAVSILEDVFPQGMAVVETPARRHVRSAYEEWRDAVDENDPLLAQLHQEWVRLVLADLLEFEDSVLADFREDESPLSVSSPDGIASFAPDFALTSASGDKPKLFISVQPPGADLEKGGAGDGWPASVVDRMTLLCRSHEVRLGLLTNGERWMLVNAPVGSTSGHTSWYARLWFQEPVTLQAFQSLLGVRRWFGPEEETLPAMLEASLAHHEEVTDTLGEQVKRAVEVLIQCLDRADQDRNRELLHDVEPAELYEAGLTVMMRLVFVLCAEERGLLLLNDPVYDQNYAVSTLRAQLEEDADQHGPEVLERRHDAWTRLLAVFRAVYGGVEHEALRMPALGGSLFDPDRFPFLEGRSKDTKWKETPARPLPIDNRTVLLLLTALQVLEQRGGALLLSYKALDVEQIGHVYEGLLEHTVRRLPQVTLGLVGSQKAKDPNVPLAQLESAALDGQRTVVDLVKDATQRSVSAIRNALKKDIDDQTFGRVLLACGGDVVLAERIRPFANLLRTDAWDEYIVYPENAFAVTLGADRRETGTHYTPKSLTESMVQTTLEPVVYTGPAEGQPREDWRLKSSAELLDLKVCDPAMGSGAFLVQVCRYLSERVVEAWGHEEGTGKFVTVDGEVLDEPGEADPLPESVDDRLTIARRLVAERCLYGVDLNPLAVELSKLSIWLVTLARGRPFGFLDHNLRSGDSLLGLHRLDQLTRFSLHPDKTTNRSLFAQNIEKSVAEAVETRTLIRETPVHDVRDVWDMEIMNRQACASLERVEQLADAMVGVLLRSLGNETRCNGGLGNILIHAGTFLDGDQSSAMWMRRTIQDSLAASDAPVGARVPFHWALEFPEVFADKSGGFDAILGNPPFMGGKRTSSVLGTDYNQMLSSLHVGTNRNTDLCAHFFRRAFSILSSSGTCGLLAVNTISEGDTRQGGLEWITRNGGNVYAAYPDQPWPGKAAVIITRVHIKKGKWDAESVLSGRLVSTISSYLSDQIEWTPNRLRQNRGIAYQGSIVLGMGFILSEEQAREMLAGDPRNRDVIFPYLNGAELNSDPRQRPSRWVINFWDWPEEKAATYVQPFEWIRDTVYPERLKKSKSKSYRNIMTMWWRHWNVRPELYHALGRGASFENHPSEYRREEMPLTRVIATSRVSKTGAFVFVKNDCVFSDAMVVFASDDASLLAFLQSSIHVAYAWKHSSQLKMDMRYTPSDIIETLPMPLLDVPEIHYAGEEYDALRSKIMLDNGIGLTPLYRRFHDPDENARAFVALRELHREIDELICRQYGWEGLSLNHDFHRVDYLPANDNLRFTISEPVRVEVLHRLALRNFEVSEKGRR